MGRITRYDVTIPSTVTNSTGTTGATSYSSYTGVLNGFVHQITVTASGTQLSSTGVLTVGTTRQAGTTGIFQGPLGTAPITYFPRAIHHTSSGGASTDATLHYDRFAVSEDRLLISTSNLNTTGGCIGIISVFVEGA